MITEEIMAKKMSKTLQKKSYLDRGFKFYKPDIEKPKKYPKERILSIRGVIKHQLIICHK